MTIYSPNILMRTLAIAFTVFTCFETEAQKIVNVTNTLEIYKVNKNNVTGKETDEFIKNITLENFRYIQLVSHFCIKK